MHISKSQSKQQNWDEVQSLNYKLKGIGPYESVVYAKIKGIHGEVSSEKLERIYYILKGKGVFEIDGKLTHVEETDVITIPPQTRYNYWADDENGLEILLFMELWDN